MLVVHEQQDILKKLNYSAIRSNKLFMAEIDVTNRCNCHCFFCFQGNEHKDSEKTLSFDRIISLLDELKNLAKDTPVGMFKQDGNLDCFVVRFDPQVLIDCFEKSVDSALVPVYYQLSQAESDKIKRGNIGIREAVAKDLDKICEIVLSCKK